MKEPAIADVIQVSASAPGPSLAVTVLMHGNEPCGLGALEAAMAEDFALKCGRLSLIVMNRAAYDAAGGAVRHLGIDMNRIWSRQFLAADGMEAARVRAALPLLDDATAVLDIHSLPDQDRPFLLVSKARPAAGRLARQLSHVVPRVVAATAPTSRGMALFETDLLPTAKPVVVVECGQHTSPRACTVAREAFLAFLAAYGLIEAQPLQRGDDGAEEGSFEFAGEIILREGPLRLARPMLGFDAIAKGDVYGWDGPHELIAEEDCHVLLTRPAMRPGDEALTLVRKVAGMPASVPGHDPVARSLTMNEMQRS